MRRLAACALVLAFGCSKKSENDEASEYARKSKAVEATLNLKRLAKNLRDVYEDRGTFPAGKAGPVPAEPCCKGAQGKCAMVPMETFQSNAIWSGLHFELFEQPRFQYAYESDGKSVKATATGDLDCDGKPGVYTLEMSIGQTNELTEQISEPPPGTY